MWTVLTQCLVFTWQNINTCFLAFTVFNIASKLPQNYSPLNDKHINPKDKYDSNGTSHIRMHVNDLVTHLFNFMDFMDPQKFIMTMFYF